MGLTYKSPNYQLVTEPKLQFQKLQDATLTQGPPHDAPNILVPWK